MAAVMQFISSEIIFATFTVEPKVLLASAAALKKHIFIFGLSRIFLSDNETFPVQGASNSNTFHDTYLGPIIRTKNNKITFEQQLPLIQTQSLLPLMYSTKVRSSSLANSLLIFEYPQMSNSTVFFILCSLYEYCNLSLWLFSTDKRKQWHFGSTASKMIGRNTRIYQLVLFIIFINDLKILLHFTGLNIRNFATTLVAFYPALPYNISLLCLSCLTMFKWKFFHGAETSLANLRLHSVKWKLLQFRRRKI